MLDNYYQLCNFMQRVQSGESLSFLEVFTLIGIVCTFIGTFASIVFAPIYTVKALRYIASTLTFSKFHSSIVQNAIERLTSKEAWISTAQPHNYVYAGPLTVGIDVRNFLIRLLTGNCNTIKIEGTDTDHVTKSERKRIIKVAKQVRKQLILKEIEESRFAAANKLSVVHTDTPDSEDVKVDENFIATEEILEMLRKRYGINVSENSKSVPF